MRAYAFACGVAPIALLAAPVSAQEMDHAMHGMAGMDHSVAAAVTPEHATEEHSAPAAEGAAVADDTPGQAAPPPVPTDHPADRFFPAARMAKARADLSSEGTWRGSALIVDQMEYRARAGRDGYAWKVTGWTGGDIDRLVIASEGEGDVGGKTERAEFRALWRHAIDPWFNLEAGVRHDVRPGPQATYATFGIEGLAPYWFEVEGQVLVSTKGDAHLRVGGSHDLRLSGPLLLQPEAEVNISLQQVPELRIGSGIERIELGARLRYEIRPEFAPYVGVHWERRLGGTARYLRAEGERASGVSAVAGIRAFF